MKAPRMNWLDRAISFVSPAAGARRARARLLEGVLSGPRNLYEGAGRGRRTEGWRVTGASANAETRTQLSLLRNRCRDLAQNNAYAARAVAVIAHNTVGAGIIPRIEGSNEAKRKRAARLVKDWLDTPLCDADGRNHFYGLQALVIRTVAESGEALIRRRWRRPSDGLPVPMQLQVLEPDLLDSGKDGPLPNGNLCHQGIEVDRLGRRVAYWLFDDHPGDGVRLRTLASKPIPAADVIHVYRQDRPGQMRGVPWGAPVIIRLRDFADYEDAQLLRQKIAACFAVFVHDDDSGPGPPSPSQGGDLLEEIGPGIVEHLPPGRDVRFAVPPGVDGYVDYSRVSLTAVAAGYGVTYEALTGDLSGVNFSSGRMGWLEMARNIDAWQWNMLIPQLCAGVWGWMVEASPIAGLGLEGVTASWTPPRREMIDPVKETEAIREGVRSGLYTQSEAIRRQGYDPETVFLERAAELKRMRELGIAFDTDAAVKPGATPPPAAPGGASDTTA
ncbi:phage portal protein [Azospirillum doebereinerae]|nr:phage portal protein [Azospirillum doebereinerae]